MTTSGLLEVDTEAGCLAVVGEWGTDEGVGDVCSCTLPSPVEEVMTVHCLIPIKFPARLPTIQYLHTFWASTNFVVQLLITQLQWHIHI